MTGATSTTSAMPREHRAETTSQRNVAAVVLPEFTHFGFLFYFILYYTLALPYKQHTAKLHHFTVRALFVFDLSTHIDQPTPSSIKKTHHRGKMKIP